MIHLSARWSCRVDRPRRRRAPAAASGWMAQHRPAALVTGSASGIGRAAALRLARAGYDVAINYRSSEDSARRTLASLSALGGRPLALRGDVSDDDAVAAMVAAVGEAYGRLD